MIELPDSDQEFRFYQQRGFYQRQAILQAMAYCRSWRMAVDAGAHVGFASIDMAKMFDSVLAFEPEPNNFECLCKNVPNNVRAMMTALGRQNGWGMLRNPTPTNSGAWEMEEGFEVHIEPLDAFKLQYVDLIKIDTQGSEVDILEGARQTIGASLPVISVELVKNGKQNDAIDRFMEDIDYAFVIQRGKDAIYVPARHNKVKYEYV